MKYQTRRGFLTAGGGALAALALGNSGCGPDEDIVEPTLPFSPERTLKVVLSDHTFNSHFLNKTITARLRTYNGQLTGPTFETFPGDLLRISVQNNLPEENHDDHDAWMSLPERKRALVPHMFNTTNLHVHGIETVPHLFDPIHTSNPTSKMLAILPGQAFHYSFPIPKDHAPGLYWYHPHHHGSTAVQVLNGMAGALIVRGPIDEVPEIKAAKEHMIVVQDLALFKSSDGSDTYGYTPTQNAIWETFQEPVPNVTGVNGAIALRDAEGKILQIQGDDGKQYTPTLPGLLDFKEDPNAKPLGTGFSTGDLPLRLFLVNGQLVFEEQHNPDAPTSPNGHQHQPVPHFKVQPGEVVRFRFLNGCSDNMIPLVVEGHDMQVIAMDGVNFPRPRTRKMVPHNQDPTVIPQVHPQDKANAQVILGPGNRVEFLIKARPVPGIYEIWQNAHGGQFLQSAAKKLAVIEVAGPAKLMQFPAKLPTSSRHYPLLPTTANKTRTIVFGMVFPAAYNNIVGLDFFMTDNEDLAASAEKLKDPATWESMDINGNKGLAYMEERVDLTINVGDVEEWTITDNHHLGTTGSQEGHPFHLHETSFEVIRYNDKDVPTDEITVQDTVWIPHGETVTIRLQFRDNAIGKSVMHCHILPHEDCGMMMNTLVAPKPG